MQPVSLRGAYLVQLVVQLRQGGSDELVPERRCRLPVKIDVGHRVDGVVAESPHVVGVRVRVVVIVVLAPRGRVQAALAHHRVPVLQPLALRRGRVALRFARVREVHDAKPAFGFLTAAGIRIRTPRRRRRRRSDGGGVAGWEGGGARGLVLRGARCLRDDVHLEAALARGGSERLRPRTRG